MVLRLTPEPMIAAGLSNAATAATSGMVLAGTATVTTVHLGAGIDDVSAKIGIEFTKTGVHAQSEGAIGVEYLFTGGTTLAEQAWMYTIADDGLGRNIPLI